MRPCAWRSASAPSSRGDPGEVAGVELQLRQRVAPVRVEAGRHQQQLRAEGVERRQQVLAPRRAEAAAAGARRQRRIEDVADAALVRVRRCPGYSGIWCELKYSTRGSASKIAWVPLPWCTSKSTIATRARPCLSSACAAATATLLNRQKPIAASAVAWWPGRPHRAERGAGGRRPARHRPRPPPRRRRATRLRRSRATAPCRDPVRPAASGRVSSTASSRAGVVHAQQLAARRARRLAPVEVVERGAQRIDHRAQALRAFGVAGAGVVREAGRMRVDRQRHADAPAREAADHGVSACGARAATALRRGRWRAPARAPARTAGRTAG